MARKLACFTLDLEPDVPSDDLHDVLLNWHLFKQFEEFIISNRIKLTTFVVGKMFEEHLPIAERFARIDTEFELHSYSHNVEEPDSEEEILRGKTAYTNYFGHPPRGYRAPNGAISPTGLSVLHREGFLYDASVFPTWRPELGYNFSHMPRTPWFYEEYPPLLELPFAVVPGVRIVISMSFLKLFGFSFYRLMFNTFGLPDIVIFDSHLYDYFLTDSVRNLSRFDWKRYAITRNHNNSLRLVQRFVDFLISRGYTFISMGELYQTIMASRQTIPVISATRLSATPRSMQPSFP